MTAFVTWLQHDTAELGRITGESLTPIGMILLVVGAGAFFGAVLQATGVGKALAGSMSAIGLPVIVSAYVISAALRLAQGSATVAIATTAGIIEPLVSSGGYSQAEVALIVIAVSAGSIIASHVNDGGFWIVAKYFNMSVKDTLKTWTVLGDERQHLARRGGGALGAPASGRRCRPRSTARSASLGRIGSGCVR